MDKKQSREDFPKIFDTGEGRFVGPGDKYSVNHMFEKNMSR